MGGLKYIGMGGITINEYDRYFMNDEGDGFGNGAENRVGSGDGFGDDRNSGDGSYYEGYTYKQELDSMGGFPTPTIIVSETELLCD